MATVVAVVGQALIIFYIHDMNMDPNKLVNMAEKANIDTEKDLDPLCSEAWGNCYLRLVCVGTFICAVFRELHDTLIFEMWIHRLPKVSLWINAHALSLLLTRNDQISLQSGRSQTVIFVISFSRGSWYAAGFLQIRKEWSSR
jgi:hypothetical protein